MAEEGEEAPPAEPGPTLLTAELIAANLSIIEEVDDSDKSNGFAYTKCDLSKTQCEVEAASDAFSTYYQLRYLSLTACKLASCQPVAPLPKLMSLDLSTAALAEPGSLPPLPSLQLLKLSSCGISSLAGCAWEYPALRALDLSSNALTELPEFGAMPSLTYLSLAGNQLPALPEGVWSRLPALATLQAEGNAPLADISGLATSPALASLSLSGCPEIGAPALLKPLAQGALRALVLSETPLAEQSVEVLLVLPSLQLLNGAPVSTRPRALRPCPC